MAPRVGGEGCAQTVEGSGQQVPVLRMQECEKSPVARLQEAATRDLVQTRRVNLAAEHPPERLGTCEKVESPPGSLPLRLSPVPRRPQASLWNEIHLQLGCIHDTAGLANLHLHI